VAAIREDEAQNPVVKVELTEEGRSVERTFDLVVLSLGMLPTPDANKVLGLPAGSDRFIAIPAPNAAPAASTRPGIFVTGTAGGPMDIVDSIITAGSAASAASAYLRKNQTEAAHA
jgi:heterodisulfide reductase subunit A2